MPILLGFRHAPDAIVTNRTCQGSKEDVMKSKEPCVEQDGVFEPHQATVLLDASSGRRSFPPASSKEEWTPQSRFDQ